MGLTRRVSADQVFYTVTILRYRIAEIFFEADGEILAVFIAHPFGNFIIL